jgi:hypothetical protein
LIVLSVLIPILMLGLVVSAVRAYSWSSADIITTDPDEVDSSIPDQYDIHYVYIANDNDNMYFRADVYSDTLQLNQGGIIEWCLDTDQDISTGCDSSTCTTCRGGVETKVWLGYSSLLGDFYVNVKTYDSSGNEDNNTNFTSSDNWQVSGNSSIVTITLESTSIATTSPISVVTHFENAAGGFNDDDAPDTGTDAYEPPTAVDLSSFDAAWRNGEVLVAWTTAMEIDTAGFNVWRSADSNGEYVQVNDALVPSAVPGSTQGGAYSFTDGEVTSGEMYYYKLEELEAGGRSNWYGPVATSALTDGGDMIPTALSLSDFAARGSAVAWVIAAGAVVLVLGGVGFIVQRRKV